MRDKVLLPLKNEIMKIQVSSHETGTGAYDKNERKDEMLDFKFVFRKELYKEGYEGRGYYGGQS